MSTVVGVVQFFSTFLILIGVAMWGSVSGSLRIFFKTIEHCCTLRLEDIDLVLSVIQSTCRGLN
jgi:hypothetical protein